MPIIFSTPKRCLIAQAANWFVKRIDPIPDQDYLAAPLDVSNENEKLRDLYLTLRANDCDLRGRLMVEFSGHAIFPQTPSPRIPMHVPPRKISDTRYINIDDYDIRDFYFKNSVIISNYFKLYDDDISKYEYILQKYYLSMDSVDNLFFEHVTVDFDRLVKAVQPKPTTRGAENKCERWLVGLMQGGKPPEMPKADYFKEAKENFAVSQRGFDRAWANAIKQSGNSDWSKPGRKS